MDLCDIATLKERKGESIGRHRYVYLCTSLDGTQVRDRVKVSVCEIKIQTCMYIVLV